MHFDIHTRRAIRNSHVQSKKELFTILQECDSDDLHDKKYGRTDKN